MYSEDEWIRHGDELRRPFSVPDGFSSSEHVVIVGGGLSGLTIAYRLASKRPDLQVTVVESKSTFGGVIDTWKEGEWVCDVAVNATRSHPSVWRLIEDLDLGKEFSQSNPLARKRWIYIDGKQHQLSWKTAFKIGLFRLRRSMLDARKGSRSVAEVLPNEQIADAMTLGIVNDVAANVDADFLFPSLTKFGGNPPIKWSKLKKKIRKTYPLFTPKKGSVASLSGGMKTLIDKLVSTLEAMSNVSLQTDFHAPSPEDVASQYNVSQSSVIWTVPSGPEDAFTSLSVYAIGYRNEDVSHIPTGYGTLIPDSNIPISGILHESDVHSSQRAPEGNRMFRLMIPASRWNGDSMEILDSARNLISPHEPVMFQHIGDRNIPSYSPGYMASLSKEKYAYVRAGWGFSGVSITHVISEAERLADLI